jgi:hypothetical protein
MLPPIQPSNNNFSFAKFSVFSIVSICNLYLFLTSRTSFRVGRCKSCAKVSLKMNQLASEHADWIAIPNQQSPNHDAANIVAETPTEITRHGAIRIINVEYGAARELCIERGIQQLPSIHMYTTTASTMAHRNCVADKERVKVQDFPCSPRDFRRVRDLTMSYIEQQQHRTNDFWTNNSIDDEFLLAAKLKSGSDMIQSSLLAEKQQWSSVISTPHKEMVVDSASVLLDDAVDTVAFQIQSTRLIPRLWRHFRP